MNEEKWSNKSCNLAKELKEKLAQKIDSVTKLLKRYPTFTIEPSKGKYIVFAVRS